MTDRRIDRSVAAHIAALDARTRHLEELIGGGIQQSIAFDNVETPFTYTDNANWTDGTPAGPSVTVRIGPAGKMIIFLGSGIAARRDGGGIMSYAVTGATTINEAGTRGLKLTNLIASPNVNDEIYMKSAAMFFEENLTPGDHTIRARYIMQSVSDETRFDRRNLLVIPF